MLSAGLNAVRTANGLVHIPETRHQISYEVHGSLHSKRRVCLVIGFRGSFRLWDDVINHYITSGPESDYAFLVIDNRGMGLSTQGVFSPTGYTTRGMALDVAAVLEAVGWLDTPDNDSEPSDIPTMFPKDKAGRALKFHLMGISMGGMICLELAAMIPDHLYSLTLLNTAAKMKSPPGQGGIKRVISEQLHAPKSTQEVIESIMDRWFAPGWKAQHDPHYPQFDTNADRFIGLMFANYQLK